jgi:hypothetical protein
VRFDGVLLSDINHSPNRCLVGPYLSGSGLVNVPRAMTSFCVHKLATTSTEEYALWAAGEPSIWGEVRTDEIVDGLMLFSVWGHNSWSTFKVPAGGYRIRTDRVSAGLNTVEMFDSSADGARQASYPLAGAVTPLPGYIVGGYDPAETPGRNLNGDIAELLIYQGALDDADLLAVTDYLQDKYFPGTRLEGAAFQWMLEGTKIKGATNTTLVLFNAQPAMSGHYSVSVSNAAGIVFSSKVVIAVTAAAPARRKD